MTRHPAPDMNEDNTTGKPLDINQPIQMDEPTPVAQKPPAKPLHTRIARYVSNILAPATISLPLVLLLAFYHAHDPEKALFYAGITLLFASLGPLIYIIIGVRLGKLSDIDVSRRSQRSGPFLFGLISVTLGLFILLALHGPKVLTTLLIITIVSGLCMMFITIWWKISIHASSLAGAATILTGLYGALMLPAFILLVLVCWSRVVLRRHTIAQVIAGSLLSITLTSGILWLRGV